MTKHFLIYGVLLFLLFEKACDIFIALVKIINENQDLSNSIIYIMLGFSVIIPTILFFFFLKKLKFNKAILKCDIEGAEYDILETILKFNEKVECILIEFHNIKSNINLFKENINNLLKFYFIISIIPSINRYI